MQYRQDDLSGCFEQFDPWVRCMRVSVTSRSTSEAESIIPEHSGTFNQWILLIDTIHLMYLSSCQAFH